MTDIGLVPFPRPAQPTGRLAAIDRFKLALLRWQAFRVRTRDQRQRDLRKLLPPPKPPDRLSRLRKLWGISGS